jgi:hypothetical protein
MVEFLAETAGRVRLYWALFRARFAAGIGGNMLATILRASALPEGAGILVSRDAVNDTVVLPRAAGGHFRVDSLPGDVLTLGVRLRSHHVSKTNASYDFVNHQGLIGSVREDLALELVLDPGPMTREDPQFDKELWKRYEELCSSPLRGRTAEASAPR